MPTTSLTYCVKCRDKTVSSSEKLEPTTTGRMRLIGICKVCGTKKHTFVSKDGTVKKKTPAEIAEAKEKKEKAKKKNEAIKIIKKLLAEQG